jgi:ribosome-binding protein aMBF1 (putative translation factor)
VPQPLRRSQRQRAAAEVDTRPHHHCEMVVVARECEKRSFGRVGESKSAAVRVPGDLARASARNLVARGIRLMSRTRHCGHLEFPSLAVDPLPPSVRRYYSLPEWSTRCHGGVKSSRVHQHVRAGRANTRERCVRPRAVALTGFPIRSEPMNRNSEPAPHRPPRHRRAAREAAGLSQRALAFPGCSPAYISRIEAGARVPRPRVLRRLAQRLEVSESFLAHGEEDTGDEHVLLDAEVAAA